MFFCHFVEVSAVKISKRWNWELGWPLFWQNSQIFPFPPSFPNTRFRFFSSTSLIQDCGIFLAAAFIPLFPDKATRESRRAKEYNISQKRNRSKVFQAHFFKWFLCEIPESPLSLQQYLGLVGVLPDSTEFENLVNGLVIFGHYLCLLSPRSPPQHYHFVKLLPWWGWKRIALQRGCQVGKLFKEEGLSAWKVIQDSCTKLSHK